MRILNSTTGAYSITLVVPLCIQVLKALQYKLLFATGSKLIATSRNEDSFLKCDYKVTGRLSVGCLVARCEQNQFKWQHIHLLLSAPVINLCSSCCYRRISAYTQTTETEANEPNQGTMSTNAQTHAVKWDYTSTGRLYTTLSRAFKQKKKTIGREKQGKSWSVADYGFLIWDFGVHSKPWARRRLHSDQQKNASIQWTKKRTERGLLSLEARRGARTHNLEIPLILRVRVSRATDCASRAGCS